MSLMTRYVLCAVGPLGGRIKHFGDRILFTVPYFFTRISAHYSVSKINDQNKTNKVIILNGLTFFFSLFLFLLCRFQLTVNGNVVHF